MIQKLSATNSARSPFGGAKVLVAFAAFVTSTFATNRSDAYTPDDPQVIQMVDRGIKYLESAPTRTAGEEILVAYTHYKVEHDESNEIVARGIAKAKELSAQVAGNDLPGGHAKNNYDVAMAVMLLCEVSPKRFRAELSTFQRYLNEVQRPHGGYTYPQDDIGDVSQTQYVVLAIWTLDRAGFKLDYNRVKKSIEWLMLVQDARGPWPYHGTLPNNNQLMNQAKTSMSMALAGAGSLLIAADALRVWGESVQEDDTGIVGLPKAVKIYKEDQNVERRKKAKISGAPLLQRCSLMERWRQSNPEHFSNHYQWYFYTIYTTERYESFLEIANGSVIDKSPAWYNQTVTELIKLQSSSGGWEVKAQSNGAVSTAFAILFLIRSTQRALGTGASATTIGGLGFKGDVSKAKLVNGKAVTKSPAQSVTGMLDLLEGDGADDLDGKAMSGSAVLATDPTQLSAQLDRLERLVRGSQSWQARRVSAKLLGMSDDLRVVPSLIFALSDPDDSVRKYARDGLRFISRKFEGYGMPDEPTNGELRQAQRKWRQWYLTMRPGHVFIDEL